MTKKGFLGLIEEIVEEDPGTLTGSEKLREQLAGWNSLAVVSFLAMVDEKFEITLAPDAISKCKTVDDLANLLDGRVTD